MLSQVTINNNHLNNSPPLPHNSQLIGAVEMDVMLPKEKKICRFGLSYGVTTARFVQTIRSFAFISSPLFFSFSFLTFPPFFSSLRVLSKTIDHIDNYGSSPPPFSLLPPFPFPLPLSSPLNHPSSRTCHGYL